MQEAQQRMNKEFMAYSMELFHAQRRRELTNYEDKIAYLSARLAQVSRKGAPQKASALQEALRKRLDGAESRLRALKQQISTQAK